VAALDGEDLESRSIHRVRRHHEPVTGRVRFDHVIEPGAAEFGPQPRHQGLQGVTGIGRRFTGPDLLGQGTRGHDTPGVQGQQNEQDAQLTPADTDGVPGPVPHLKRAKQPDTQPVRRRPTSAICVRAVLPPVQAGSPGSFNPSHNPTLPNGPGSNINRQHERDRG
jgi:hypothetical protein